MLKVKNINENSLSLFIVGVISCFFAFMILQYEYKAIAFLFLLSIALVFFIKVEYVFYFLLLSRSIIDLLYSTELTGNIRVTHYIGILVVTLFASYFIVTGYNIFRSSVNKVYLVFISLAVFPIFFTQNLIDGFADWLKLLQIILVLNMTILVVKNSEVESIKNYKEKVNKICWCIVIALCIPYIMYLKNLIQGNYIVLSGYVRYATFGSYANEFSYYLLAAFPIFLFFYSVSLKRSTKIFWFVLMVIMLITIYKTYTRNVWIGIAVLILVWNLLRKNFKFIFLVLIVLMIIGSFSSEIRERFSDISEILESKSVSNIDPKLLSGRVNRWGSNIKYFISESTFVEKLFGNGFDVHSRVVIFADDFSDSAAPEHNNYLTLLMNTGILGLCTYCLYIFVLFKESFKLLRRTHDIYFKNFAQVFISILSSYVIVSVFTHMIWKTNYQFFFAALSGIVIAANTLLKERGVEKK